MNAPQNRVEDHLAEIRQALALATVVADLQIDLSDHYTSPNDVAVDATVAMRGIMERAWRAARDLSCGLSSEVQDIRIGPAGDDSEAA